MYPEEIRKSSNSLEQFCVLPYSPSQTPPNEEQQSIRPLLSNSPRNPQSTPPNFKTGSSWVPPSKDQIIWGLSKPKRDFGGVPYEVCLEPQPTDTMISVPELPAKRLASESSEEENPWALTEMDSAEGPSWSELSGCGKLKRVVFGFILKPIAVTALLYFFICSLDLMSSAFRLLGGKEAGMVLSDSELLNNPVCGLMIGILVTVLVQSSSTSTSIVVSIVAAGLLQVKQAVYIIMGANIGTSVTNTIVALTHAGQRNEFRRAFGAATVHDMFNWLSVLVFLPIEVVTQYLYRLTSIIVSSFHISTNENAKFDILKKLTKPFTSKIIQLDKKVINKIAVGEVEGAEESLLKKWCNYEKEYFTLNSTNIVTENGTTSLPPVTGVNEVPIERCQYIFANTDLSERAVGGILLGVSLVMLCTCLIFLVKLLHSLMKGRMSGIIKRTINANFPGPFAFLTGYIAIFVGAVVTFIVQSSSVFTSTVTPLVGMGVITLERVYPLTLGANIGTTATGMLAALASSGSGFEDGIQIALCHLFFNISGILVWYPIPFMRKVPVYLAKTLGNTTAKYRWFAILYLVILFFLLPVAVFGLSIVSVYLLAAVGIPFLLIFATVIIINIIQHKRPSLLPKNLQTWDSFPLWMHSLKPFDRLLSKINPRSYFKKSSSRPKSCSCHCQREVVATPKKYSAVIVISGKESEV